MRSFLIYGLLAIAPVTAHDIFPKDQEFDCWASRNDGLRRCKKLPEDDRAKCVKRVERRYDECLWEVKGCSIECYSQAQRDKMFEQAVEKNRQAMQLIEKAHAATVHIMDIDYREVCGSAIKGALVGIATGSPISACTVMAIEVISDYGSHVGKRVVDIERFLRRAEGLGRQSEELEYLLWTDQDW